MGGAKDYETADRIDNSRNACWNETVPLSGVVGLSPLLLLDDLHFRIGFVVIVVASGTTSRPFASAFAAVAGRCGCVGGSAAQRRPASVAHFPFAAIRRFFPFPC